MTQKEIIIDLNKKLEGFSNVKDPNFFDLKDTSYISGCIKGLLYARDLIIDLESENENE